MRPQGTQLCCKSNRQINIFCLGLCREVSLIHTDMTAQEGQQKGWDRPIGAEVTRLVPDEAQRGMTVK